MAQKEYYVEKILDKKYVDGKTYYLVKWEGYPEDESTWEPYKNLAHLKDMLKEFEKSI
jgi:hypothetical protein